jgi:competence protein ComEC
MLDGLGMAETTPGPLIMVVQFVGFMGAYRNPGAFNYPEFLRLRSIHATALASPRALERIKPMERFAFQRWLFGFRDRMRAHLREAFPEKTAGLLEAITLGIRENLDGEVRESFRLAGASHILAISGLHVGFITFFFYFVFLAFFRRLPPDVFPARPIVLTPMKAASLAVIPIVILFALLTGARVSTIRAAIMAVVYLLTRILERPGGAMHSVLLAAIIILAARHLPRPTRRSGWEIGAGGGPGSSSSPASKWWSPSRWPR